MSDPNPNPTQLQIQALLFDDIMPVQQTENVAQQDASTVSVTEEAQSDMFGELYFK